MLTAHARAYVASLSIVAQRLRPRMHSCQPQLFLYVAGRALIAVKILDHAVNLQDDISRESLLSTSVAHPLVVRFRGVLALHGLLVVLDLARMSVWVPLPRADAPRDLSLQALSAPHMYMWADVARPARPFQCLPSPQSERILCADALVLHAQVSTYRVATVRVDDVPMAGDDRRVDDERIARRRVRRLDSKVRLGMPQRRLLNISCWRPHKHSAAAVLSRDTVSNDALSSVAPLLFSASLNTTSAAVLYPGSRPWCS